MTRWSTTQGRQLRWLRERRLLSRPAVAALARRLDKAASSFLTPDNLKSWEAGRAAPPYEALGVLAAIYECPVEAFYARRKRWALGGAGNENNEEET